MPPSSLRRPTQRPIGRLPFAVPAIGLAVLIGGLLSPVYAQAQTPVDITASGTPIALVTTPTGGGSKDIEVIRDGDTPPVGNNRSNRQYDTYDGSVPAAEDWIGYQYSGTQTFTQVVFQEGKHFSDGGWFNSLGVQVLQSGVWTDVSGLVSTPAYPAINDGINYQTYTLDFTASPGLGIRIDGVPDGADTFISVGELRVFGIPHICGDGIVNVGSEDCDTAGESASCDADCTLVVCGDGTTNLSAGEICDTNGESATCNADCTAAVCGDGQVNTSAGEACDTSGESATCNTDCSLASCGDGKLNLTAGESCDTGGESATCNADCTPAACGDGQINTSAGESCEPPDTAICTAGCTSRAPLCGDGFVTAPESCDDSNLTDGDGCDSNCTATACGNGVITAGEQCDDGNLLDGDACDSSCQLTPCGNGVLDAGEACDDGNFISGDGCDVNCTVTACGNGILTAPETCDDGNLIDGDGCDSNCTVTACSNGILTAPEICDDGNLTDGDGCDSNCTATACGNGILTAPETCDDGNLIDADGCDSNCTATACGNGILTAPETCDDGNLIDADGCDSNCTATACGNGILTAPEACDDGNLIAGDGCSDTCVAEFCGDGLLNNNGVETCEPPNTATCAADCSLRTASDLTQLGTPIALVTAPTGGGNRNLEVIRDGDKPPVGNNKSNRQYDTYDGSAPAPDDWIGYEYLGTQSFIQVIFQEGKHFAGGGWFDSLMVQVRQAGIWSDATGLVSTPAYPAFNDGLSYETYTLDFDAISGEAIRIFGDPGGFNDFISVGELEVFGFSQICGDGILAAPEQCDDGNTLAGDSCGPSCLVEFCGDGVTNNLTEACDTSGESATCNADCTAALCGDGQVNTSAGEACDTSGESATCNTDCSLASCGDGKLNLTAGESCDTGGESATCNLDCTPATCGDGQVNTSAGESCEPPDTATCTATCTDRAPLCGDGFVTAPESCDDGNLIDGDGCDSNCTATACGNGVITAGEQCDDGNLLDGDACDSSCQLTPCGNGVLDAGEACDDGNFISGDGCDINCTLTACGNGILTAPEACDDGNLADADGCDSNCTATACGNSILTAPEICDDGNLTDGDGCDSNCTATACGNGILTAPEICDDGNLADADGCDSNCTATACGNGVLTAPEICDDGNLIDADGCDSNCTATACGNGVLTAPEACDDGNLIAGDGCSDTCVAEFCGDGLLNNGGVEACEPPNTVTCAADCSLRTASDLTQLGTPIALVTAPTGSGNKNLEVIRDGDKPPVGNNTSNRQYDTYDGSAPAPDDWIGYTYTGMQTFTGMVFQEGKVFGNGGWFDFLTVQVRQAGVWTDVTGLISTPPYPLANNGITFETYALDFDPALGDGIRIYGDPGGTADFITVGELEVFGFSQICGDGILTAPEQCDDGNTVGGDGCGPSCFSEFCGDGVVNNNGSEACDTAGESVTCNSDCTLALCGDGKLNLTAGEACDTSGESATCNTDCSLASCGDGKLNLTAGESCDTGGESATCNGDCTPAACGDGQVNASAGESCEPPDTATCAATCTDRAPLCGDGFVTAPESCDDGNLIDGDGCDSNCTATACGNGIVTAGEQCDDGNLLDGDACDSSCQLTPCGNGVLDAGEACDDGNFISGDGCDVNCTVTACGNGILTAPEACDDGNLIDGDGCDSNCTVTACGNSILAAPEICDDGNLADGDGCDSNCTATACGNGILTAPEICDDGNLADGDGCDSNCTVTACGNNILTAPEVCDDGNLIDADGCDSNCTATACGNGILTTPEACDDGNTVAGDGCSDSCVVEFCGDSIVNNGEDCDPPATALCNADCTSRVADDLTQLGTPIALVTVPTGGGNKNIEVIRDGDKPPVGNNKSNRQYDTYDGGAPAAEDWMGYQYTGLQTFRSVVFQEGKHFGDGGWFDSLTVQVLQGGVWSDVAGLSSTPVYPAVNNGLSYEIYALDFDAAVGDGIRIHGAPGGNSDFISVGELEVFGIAHTCGDGVFTPPEQCDDGNLTPGDGCGPTCLSEFCGDGIINNNGSEVCDDGGESAVCDADCTAVVCGDTTVNTTAGETCEPPDTDTCNAGCTARVPLCGDGFVTPPETCDDGNPIDGDGCDNNCTITACGNGIVTAGEECDDGNLIDNDACDLTCHITPCGNGVLDAGEACDDGNQIQGDGCDSNCSLTACGNFIVTAGESCDDGNLVDGDGCDSNCTPTACGNGILTAGELCEDGNSSNTDSCLANCTPASCGDGFVFSGVEECDDGASNSDVTPNACRTTCQLAFCGDGVLDSGEACEPAGTANCGFDCLVPSGISLPPGFQDSVVFSGLTQPTAVRFAPDGRIFIAEKSGIIKVFDDLDDPSPDIFADLRTEVHNFGDRGLLGLALHPNFPTEPYVFVLYTYDAEPGGTAPRWGQPGQTFDTCPNPPGAQDGCVVQGRLSRFEAFGNTAIGSERVMIENWCQQFLTHSVGDLVFGSDGALYVSGGEGAGFTFSDYGQKGFPWLNPCNDPPSGIGGTQTPPTAEGGSLRSQDIRTTGDPTDYSGTVLRVNPNDDAIGLGEALPDNPLFGGAFSDDDRIIAYGLRNPFRLAVKPDGSDEIWISECGASTYEEVNRIASPTDGVIENFGWPCYEGPNRQKKFKNLGLDLCDSLYADPTAVTPPFFSYNHAEQVVPGEICGSGSATCVVGAAFYQGSSYPSEYQGAFLFADYSRGCIWTMLADGSGTPDPATRQTLVARAPLPVDLQNGPNGDIFYAELSGAVHRITYSPGNQPPVAALSVDTHSGRAPLSVFFDAADSSDADPADVLSYSWDLDGNGAYIDASGVTASFVYTVPGTYSVGVLVDDGNGGSDMAQALIIVGSALPASCSIDSDCDDTLFCNGLEVCSAGACSDGNVACPGAACDEANMVCLAGNPIRGGRLWDRWWREKGTAAPTGDHPLYPVGGSQSGSATFRCKECHGWDYKGAAGQYSSGVHFTGIPGVLGSTMSPQAMFDLIKTDTVANGHGFGSYGLNDQDTADLVNFLQNLLIDDSAFIDITGTFLGDPIQGQTNYTVIGQPQCVTCHGVDGTAINFGSPSSPEYVGTVAVQNPWELMHKVRFGQPGTAMPSWVADGKSNQGTADIGSYAQQNFPQ